MMHVAHAPAGRLRLVAGAVVVILVTTGAAQVAAAARPVATAPTAPAVFRGWTAQLPAGWPVVSLQAEPDRCVRFDVHAVYLGRPGAHPACPSHRAGRTESLLVEPIESPSDPRPADLTSSTVRVDPPLPPAALAAHEVRVAIPSAGVVLTAAWGADPAAVVQVLGSATATPSYQPAPGAPSARAARATSGASPRVVGLDGFTGKGFDACAAPSQDLLNAWSGSPYRAVGAYIGGVNRACSQPNLTGTWVNQVMDAGWRVIAIYVGLQAPSTSCGCARLDPNQAASQGAAAADDAVAQASAVAMGPGSTLFNDMEGYNTTPSDSQAVLAFLSAWSVRLHQLGYRSGVYSSANSGIYDLAHADASTIKPDVIWFARWDDQPTTTNEPSIPEGEWVHARVHQYGTGTESWGGASLDIDRNAVDVANPSTPFVKAAYADFLGRAPTADELHWVVTQLDGNGETHRMVVQSLAASTEWVSAIVAGLYQSTLGRPGEPGGVSYWTHAILAGQATVTQVTAAFYASDEYYGGVGGTTSAWVSDLYRKLLHRSPEPGGQAYWTDRTAAVGRGAVALDFVQSPESRLARVDALYQKLLGRLPDATGAGYWADRVGAEGDLALAADLAASDEYTQRALARFG